jgi:hypothetical protein
VLRPCCGLAPGHPAPHLPGTGCGGDAGVKVSFRMQARDGWATLGMQEASGCNKSGCHAKLQGAYAVGTKSSKRGWKQGSEHFSCCPSTPLGACALLPL